MHELSPLQHNLLEAFFERADGFVLSGGAALVGFFLHHRETRDLDLFTEDRGRMEEGERALRESADGHGWRLEPLQRSPSFRRFLVRGDNDVVVVDLVFDPVPRGNREFERHGVVIVATPQEVLAGKLCALLSRGEVRDLVDVMLMERAGFDLETALAEAADRDTAFTPAQLAWVLSEIEIGRDATIPAGVRREGLKRWLDGFIQRLSDLAFPNQG